MNDRSLERSRAESLFAELLVEDASPSNERLNELRSAHPELVAEFDQLHAELLMVRSKLADWAAPAWSGAEAPPDLGAFRCLRRLGRGGMGEVWEAEDVALGRRVAIKLMRDDWGVSESKLSRFRREAQAAGRVQHPAIVAIHQIGEHDGRAYIAQELVAGGFTLRDAIEALHREAELPADHAIRVAERFLVLAEALEVAHAAGIVHRDLKPQNVLLTAEGEPKIADFGLAVLSNEASLSRSGEFVGTYLYASPEQLSGGAQAVGAPSDMFSLGATLYESLVLRRAFEGDSIPEVTRAVTSVDPPAPHLLRRRIPRDLSLICMKMLEKRPADRYSSMSELALDLQRFLADEPIQARAPSIARRGFKWLKRHPTLATAFTLSIAASLAFAMLFLRADRLRVLAKEAQAETETANQSLVAAADELQLESASREEVIDFLVRIFESADPALAMDRVPSVRELLDLAEARLLGDQIEDPRVRARLLGSLGGVRSRLGDAARALELLEQAVHTWESLGMSAGTDAAEAEISRAVVLGTLGRREAERERMQALIDRVESEPEFAARFGAQVYSMFGHMHMNSGDYDAAESAFDRADDLYALGPEDPELETTLALRRAQSRFLEGRLEEASAQLQEVIERNPERIARAHPDMLMAVNLLGMTLIAQQRLDEAEALYLDLQENAARSLDRDHPVALMFRMNLARVYDAQKLYPKAEALYRELLVLFVNQRGPTDLGVLTIRNNIGAALWWQGRLVEAEQEYREVWEAGHETFGPTDRFTLRTQHNLARTLLDLGRAAEAMELQRAVVAGTAPDDPAFAGRRLLLDSISEAEN